MHGLWHLAWLEAKIFVREPLGALSTVLVPALAYIGAQMAGTNVASSRFAANEFSRVDLPVLAAMFMALSTTLSLATIVANYREGGILRRLRATPLRPITLVAAHVLVKLGLTAATLLVLWAFGRRVVPPPAGASMTSFAIALVLSTGCLLSVGFLLASVVPTARFVQPVGALILYPLIGVSGLFFPVDVLPPVLQVVARVSPLTHAVSLLQGTWTGGAWAAHATDVGALVAGAVVLSAVATRVFRWE